MIKKTSRFLNVCLFQLLVIVTFSTFVVQGAKPNTHAEAHNRQQQTTQGSTTKANFSGTWTLDKANSEGLPPGMDQIMTVVQTGDKLSLETKLITEQGEQVVPDSYILGGKEVDFTPRTPGGGSGKGKRVAKLGADGNSIEVSEKSTFDGPEGAVNLQATRKWMLSPDGKTLKIDMTVDGPNGQQVIKRTFIRK